MFLGCSIELSQMWILLLSPFSSLALSTRKKAAKLPSNKKVIKLCVESPGLSYIAPHHKWRIRTAWRSASVTMKGENHAAFCCVPRWTVNNRHLSAIWRGIIHREEQWIARLMKWNESQHWKRAANFLNQQQISSAANTAKLLFWKFLPKRSRVTVLRSSNKFYLFSRLIHIARFDCCLISSLLRLPTRHLTPTCGHKIIAC